MNEVGEASEELSAVGAYVIELAPQGPRRIVLRSPGGETMLTAAQANELRLALDAAIARYDDPAELEPPERARASARARSEQDLLEALDDIGDIK